MRREQLYVGELTVEKMLNQYGRDITPGANPHGGKDYFVDGNASASGGGDSWDRPFTTLAAAISASNTSIALTSNRWWARRNRIFVVGDALDENLTQLPTKCDVIGCGSYNGNTKAGLSGRHSSAAEAYGTRFFNMHFLADAYAAAIFTLAGANSASGIEFHGCTFDAIAGTVTSGILSTAMPRLGVYDCEFTGAFATSYISFGAGEAGGAKIVGNIMAGAAAAGIIVASDTTTSWPAHIRENFIEAATFCIDDNSDLFYLSRNDMVSLADDYATGLDINSARTVGCEYTAPNVAGPYPALDTTT